MSIKNNISDDTWNVIKDNYERCSYTTSIQNLITYINDIIRDRSGLNHDGTALMDKAFLGSNPALQINKNQTQTEKDIQSGIGYLLKGVCLSIRNPRAHEIYDDNKEIADDIIRFLNYILGFIRDSKMPTLIDDWVIFLFDKDFPNTKEYADYVFNEVPENKRYDLLVIIFRNRENAIVEKLNNFINKLIESIKDIEYKEFINEINKELISCKNDTKLKMFMSIFPPEKWNDLNHLAKLRVEDIIRKSINDGIRYICFDEGEEYYDCNNNGILGTSVNSFIEHFETKDAILDTISKKMISDDEDESSYVLEYFEDVIFNEKFSFTPQISESIKIELVKHRRYKYYSKLDEYMFDEKWNLVQQLFYDVRGIL